MPPPQANMRLRKHTAQHTIPHHTAKRHADGAPWYVEIVDLHCLRRCRQQHQWILEAQVTDSIRASFTAVGCLRPVVPAKPTTTRQHETSCKQPTAAADLSLSMIFYDLFDCSIFCSFPFSGARRHVIVPTCITLDVVVSFRIAIISFFFLARCSFVFLMSARWRPDLTDPTK